MGEHDFTLNHVFRNAPGAEVLSCPPNCPANPVRSVDMSAAVSDGVFVDPAVVERMEALPDFAGAFTLESLDEPRSRGGRLPDPGLAAVCARCGAPRSGHGGPKLLGACPGERGLHAARFQLRDEDKPPPAAPRPDPEDTGRPYGSMLLLELVVAHSAQVIGARELAGPDASQEHYDLALRRESMIWNELVNRVAEADRLFGAGAEDEAYNLLVRGEGDVGSGAGGGVDGGAAGGVVPGSVGEAARPHGSVSVGGPRPGPVGGRGEDLRPEQGVSPAARRAGKCGCGDPGCCAFRVQYW